MRAEFEYSAPAHVAEYRKLFQCPLHFNQSRTALIFPSEFGEQRPIRSRYELVRFLNRIPVDFKVVPGNATNLESNIRLMVLEKSGEFLNFPRFESVAEQLNMSPKTLQRKLRSEGISYQNIKESIRRDFIVEDLRNPEMSVKEIAYRAGFLETTSLNRLFIKWTGMTPTSCRKEVVLGEIVVIHKLRCSEKLK